MKTKTNTKAGSIRTHNHNESLTRSNSQKRNDRQSEQQKSMYGIKVMNVRTGVKAGWISRNYK